MKLTIISHFYNEEFLLPYWLKHHTKMFDHGVMIDYQSTDSSVEIIRELAPTWEIRPSRNKKFDPFTLDLEVMDIEQEFRGWKMVLNTTEFVLHHDLKKAIKEVEDKLPHYVGILPAGVIMCDSSQEYNQPVDDTPLFFQRHSGWIEPVPPEGGRHRLLHRAATGRYDIGRHATYHQDVVYRDDIFCLWFGWSPYPQVKNRKLQIKPKMSETKDPNLGLEHKTTRDEMDKTFWEKSDTTKNLLSETGYTQQLELVRKHLYD